MLEGENVDGQLRSATARVVEQVVRQHTEGFNEDWDLEALWAQLKTLYPVGLDLADYEETQLTPEEMVADFVADADAAYDHREESLGADVMREVERRIVLTVLDRKWREHLYEMDYLREGIGLRAMAQRDPLVEYQREGGDMFNAMMDAFLEESIGFLFNLEVQTQAGPQVGVVTDATGAPEDIPRRALTYSGPSDDGGVEVDQPEQADAQDAPAQQPANRAARRGNRTKKRR